MNISSYLGMCTAQGCEWQATARVQVVIGDFPLITPMCDDHLVAVKRVMEDLRGHDLVTIEDSA